ncbi:ASCH domain-containing protein [Balneatrix alpica]|uniref:ASCH domain-containing protein n=1 Tax=Balneatrix alpica TaxID=75684 RepID=UPI0027385A81|nr:ASCH domain-containing protein [Balneatrix alpica]
MSLPPLPDLTNLLTQYPALTPRPNRIDGFGDSPAMCAELLDLIRRGGKRAGASLLWTHQAEASPLPQQGDIVLVVDALNQPALLLQTLAVEVCPFAEVSADFAAAEGEGDGSLAYWREAHWSFFNRECALIGRSPSPSMPVVCERFALLKTL